MLNIRTGSKIQNWLMVLKLSPIVMVIAAGLFFLQGDNLTPVHQIWEGIPSAIPLVLHALLGFEVACAISRNIENPEVNAPRAVLISYTTVVVLYVLYQTIFYGILGSDLAAQADYRGAFPLLISKFAISDHLRNILGHLIHLAIAMSALSAGFGMIYANMWNLYTLAELKHTIVPAQIMQLNRYNIPFICVLAQGAIMLSYMLIIRGEQVTFQQLSAFGTTITYTLSLIGLLATLLKNKQNISITIFGLINCGILLSASFYAMWKTSNPIPLLIFIGIVIGGVIMYWMANHNKHIDHFVQRNDF
jgi:amino acid transporter